MYGCQKDYPRACFQILPEPGIIALNQEIIADASCSENYTEIFWDFGGGAKYTGTKPTHHYTQEGVYEVKLIAKNKIGSDTATITYYVQK